MRLTEETSRNETALRITKLNKILERYKGKRNKRQKLEKTVRLR